MAYRRSGIGRAYGGNMKIRRGIVTAVADRRSSVAKNKPGTMHAHRCVDCHLRYEDPCWEPREDKSCGCTSQRYNRPVWLRDKDPIECCRLYAQPITNVATLEKYALAGQATWWQCPICFRSMPFNPTE